MYEHLPLTGLIRACAPLCIAPPNSPRFRGRPDDDRPFPSAPRHSSQPLRRAGGPGDRGVRAPKLAEAATIAGGPWSPETRQSAGRGQRLCRSSTPTIPSRCGSPSPTASARAYLTSMAMIVAEELECDLRQGEGRIRFPPTGNLTDNNVYIQSMGAGSCRTVTHLACVPAASGRFRPRAARRGSRGEIGVWSPPRASPAIVVCGTRPRGAGPTFGELAADAAKVAHRRGARDQDARPVQADRPGTEAHRYAAQGDWLCALRDRHPFSLAWPMPRSRIAPYSSGKLKSYEIFLPSPGDAVFSPPCPG